RLLHRGRGPARDRGRGQVREVVAGAAGHRLLGAVQAPGGRVSTLTVEALGAAADAVERHLGGLVEERFASRLFAQDATLWGPEAESEAAVRLSWVGLARSYRPLVGEVSALREQLRERGVRRIVLCG